MKRIDVRNAQRLIPVAHCGAGVNCNDLLGHTFPRRVGLIPKNSRGFTETLMNRQDIEKEIQDKGLTAPRVTPERLANAAIREATEGRTMNEETAREIAWRLRNISEMLMARGASGERLYGCDGWSTPIANINELLVYVERQAFAGPNA